MTARVREATISAAGCTFCAFRHGRLRRQAADLRFASRTFRQRDNSGLAWLVRRSPDCADALRVGINPGTARGVALYSDQRIAAAQHLGLVLDAETAQWAAMCVPSATWIWWPPTCGLAEQRPRLIIHCVAVAADGTAADPAL